MGGYETLLDMGTGSAIFLGKSHAGTKASVFLRGLERMARRKRSVESLGNHGRNWGDLGRRGMNWDEFPRGHRVSKR